MLRNDVLEVLSQAKEDRKPYTVLAASDRMLKLLDTLVRMSEESRKQAEVNLKASPEYQELVERMSAFMRRHPELEEELREVLA